MLRPSVRSGILFVAIFALLSTGSTVSNSFAQSTPEPSQSPELSDPYSDPGIDGIGYLTISPAYLKKVAGDTMSEHEASKTVKIVFFDRPQGQEVAKIERGILSQGDKVINQDFSAPLWTYYDQSSFTVLEKRSGGWYRIRYLVGQGAAGVGWVQVKKQDPLIYLSWQKYFLGNDVIEFRNQKGNNLLTQPSSAGKKLMEINGGITIREFRGDWIRVTFQEKVFICDTDTPKNTRVRSGWVKWRDRGKLLITVPPKGC